MEDHTIHVGASSAQGASFSFDGNVIRTIKRAGEVWFVAADVCKLLGLKDTSMALASLDANEWSSHIVATKGGTHILLTFNELGLYRVIFRSDKKHSRDVQRWLIDEVAPAIRKNDRREFGHED